MYVKIITVIFKGCYVVTLSEYKKRKNYLICVDSDGCAMDTMDVKHIECFGPCMVDEWNLHKFKIEILSRWNEINLYTMTRGINRFKGLAKALLEINEKYVKIEDVESIVNWVENAKELSNDALTIAIKNNPSSIGLKKALNWSIAVNKAITLLPNEKKVPFANVKEALEFAQDKVDIAIVSSANLEAVLEEWERHGLIDYVDIVLSQNVGSKAFCIAELVKKGYDVDKVLMCGDAPGDLDAAKKNGVFYYPIIVKREKESWQEFINVGLNNLISGKYGGEYQDSKINAFLENLGAK